MLLWGESAVVLEPSIGSCAQAFGSCVKASARVRLMEKVVIIFSSKAGD